MIELDLKTIGNYALTTVYLLPLAGAGVYAIGHFCKFFEKKRINQNNLEIELLNEPLLIKD